MSWVQANIFATAESWFTQQARRVGAASDRSPWWLFAYEKQQSFKRWLQDFAKGEHRFSPLREYFFAGESTKVWSYPDRLMIHLLLKIIRPTFKHVISKQCFHLSGPSSLRKITALVKAALTTNDYHYAIRLDIRSYYASIDHEILLKQLKENYDDPKLINYFQQMITVAVDKNAQLTLPKKGIPLRSALSPFFGALYLTPLDRAFEQRKGVLYVRFMDDVLILFKTKRQLTRARKKIFTILRELKLQISPHKTKMGPLKEGFHFLGVDYCVSQNAQNEQVMTTALHARSCRRALDKVEQMCNGLAVGSTEQGQTVSAGDTNRTRVASDTKRLRTYAVHPAHIQRYLVNWAAWWTHVVGVSTLQLLEEWVVFAHKHHPSFRWLGSGLLLGSGARCRPLA